MTTKARRFDLQLFAEDPAGDPKPDPKPDPAGDAKPDPKEPFATFPDEKSFMARVNREAGKALADKAKALGFDSVDAMEAAIKAAKEADEAKKSELDKAKETAAAAEAKSKEALSAANDRLLRAEVKLQAAQLGIVDPDAAYALMNRDGVKVDDAGNVTGVKEALTELLQAKPYLKGQVGAGKSGSEFPGGGGSTLTLEQIRKMRPEEINERWDDVQKVLSAQRK